jgi:hypothetical protein
MAPRPQTPSLARAEEAVTVLFWSIPDGGLTN